MVIDDLNIRGLGKCGLNGADIFRCISSCLSMLRVIYATRVCGAMQPQHDDGPDLAGPLPKKLPSLRWGSIPSLVYFPLTSYTFGPLYAFAFIWARSRSS